ncbi:unnamed protein product [Heligmosomoides polygyrus]|uniref:Selenoprotein K n=1 Tax=Heligmosomoides polygyrus TaxID=6339 RepID=A0A183FYM9_HELPZ|nr:unnamed protein product [Heligmosomoides polygyrus]
MFGAFYFYGGSRVWEWSSVGMNEDDLFSIFDSESSPGAITRGNVVEAKSSILSYILSFFSIIALFFKSLLGLSSSTDTNASRDHLRRSNGGGRWPGSGGPGGPGRNGGTRRNIGGLPRSSGMSCPPMAGGG